MRAGAIVSSMPAFTLGTQVVASLDGLTGGASREWLVTDGIGGFAMGTASGLRTRRYHALLVVPVNGGRARMVALASLDPVLTLQSGATVPLYTHEWASGATQPHGYRHLELFELVGGLPRWRWRIGEVVVERELAMAHGRSAVGVVHRIVAAPGPVTLALTALCTWRDAGGERRAGDPPPRIEPAADGAIVEDRYRLVGPGWRARGEWWFGAYAREEGARGFNAVEDLWCAGTFHATLTAGETMEVSAWAGDLRRKPARATAMVATARRRARTVVTAAKPDDGIDATLALAADAFIIRAPDKTPDVVAGYPWFGPWPRDTMTAYEGLFLCTGRADDGAALLRRYATRLLREPTAAVDLGADGPLWFVDAVGRHVARTGDTDLAARLLPALDAVVTGYTAGSLLAADPPRAVPLTSRDAPWPGRVDHTDGLLALAPREAATTWMNAPRGEAAMTPRDGKPVELNALWVNALATIARLREKCRQDASGLWTRHNTAQRNFTKRYATTSGWLYDVIDARPGPYPLGGDERHDDPVLRPNQLLAYSLPYGPLETADPRAVRTVGASLLTPLGIRTLAPAEYGYRGAYTGSAAARAEAYHQGSAWPWLIGAYAGACRVAGLPTAGLLRGLEAHLGEWGLGSVSELVDGDPPHRAGGCPFSARSVAELIRTRALLRTPSRTR